MQSKEIYVCAHTEQITSKLYCPVKGGERGLHVFPPSARMSCSCVMADVAVEWVLDWCYPTLQSADPPHPPLPLYSPALRQLFLNISACPTCPVLMVNSAGGQPCTVMMGRLTSVQTTADLLPGQLKDGCGYWCSQQVRFNISPRSYFSQSHSGLRYFITAHYLKSAKCSAAFWICKYIPFHCLTFTHTLCQCVNTLLWIHRHDVQIKDCFIKSHWLFYACEDNFIWECD